MILFSVVVLSWSHEPIRSKAQQPPQARPAPTPPDETGLPELGPEETLTIGTTLINVPASVLDRQGRFVPDLQQSDFRLEEDGVEQRIAFFNSVETPFNVVLLIDTSMSTTPRRHEIRKAAVSFLDQLRPDDNVMVVTFDGSLRVLNKPTHDRAALSKAVEQISCCRAGTLLYSTVEVLLAKFFNRIHGKKALVVLSDGLDADYRVHCDSCAELAKGGQVSLTGFPSCDLMPCVTDKQNLHDAEESGVLIYPLQFTDPRDEDLKRKPKFANTIKIFDTADQYMRQLAERTGGRFYSAIKAEPLEPVFTSIAEELRHQYSLGYYPANKPQPGERRAIKVRVSRPDVVVRARTSYLCCIPSRSQ